VRITIQKIGLESGRVEFSSDWGQAKGMWCGDMPQVGQQVDVELDIPVDLKWGVDIIPTDQGVHAIRVEGDVILLFVFCEAVDTDGVVTARLGGSLLLLDTSGNPGYCPGHYLVKTRQLLLYSIGF
jgi:hypothetical protein